MRWATAGAGLLVLVAVAVWWRDDASLEPFRSSVVARVPAEASDGVPASMPETAAVVERAAIGERVEDVAERIARATTVKDAIRALGLEPGVGLGPKSKQEANEEQRQARDRALRALAEDRTVPDGERDAAQRLRGLHLQWGALECELAWRAWCAGDYCYLYRGGDDQARKAFFARFMSRQYGGAVMIVFPRDPEFARLQRAIDIEEFNMMPKAERRRILALRAKDLADPDADRRWLRDYFPGDSSIDPITATIR